MTVTITPVNALRYAREIKELFLAHGRPEFPDSFDRAYPPAFANGATSWLGRDPSGRLVMHVACLPRRFRFAGRDVVGGLTVNLLVAQEYRFFFPALALIRRVVQDSAARGDIDFLYADPNQESSALLRGTPFKLVGTLGRYVLPAGDRRVAMDAGTRLLHGLVRLANGAPGRAAVVARPATSYRAERFWVPADGAPSLCPHHSHALYASRLAGYPRDGDLWFTCHRRGPTSPPDAALLVRGPDHTGWAGLRAVRRLPGVSLASLVPGVLAELRRRGCRRLEIMTVAESELGRALRRCGFVPRRERVPLFALGLTPAGEQCVRAVSQWEITDLDCDR